MFQKSTPPPMDTEYKAPTSSENDDVETVVGPSVHVEGDFASEGNILVKGSVSGNVKTSKLLTVEKGAQILANVRAGSAHISGNIKGNVKVEDRIELTSSAQILGDITCSTLVVEPGALVQGKVMMSGVSIVGGEESGPSRTSRSRRSVKQEDQEEQD
ncbi:MAG: hypothetical protein CO030_02450 [Candidatus Magasanikbacteria bacterium CG_4_9_14_0_2_um_filter_42_11]|uniref:Cell shape determination protein CcmA n=1 Tax=Candidatus Magasanikbacteria bacterium CG_4_9_14_0_2_um_filter_42_11 TaxID=1974643 RepID=A0A2M8F9U9_9BACT|nr:MAG: hypothetical protein COU34_01885 [Candidatus Magasanikbacteria bacterium CG10_big_fil_rev_8_21_14_0_10_43_9]PIY93036.1 MAG: hypothetical protein COY70_00115 [Candidatus Magasanikbacteria bacterium CG_4_10_14_0_8_um_filter_42_12]PJC52512.1 MAG: hypothetical protein CO030_02450 [Candidatus Magasanikbacteria bacterium CG_4_9_14_0_2_um_filter_42_11]